MWGKAFTTHRSLGSPTHLHFLLQQVSMAVKERVGTVVSNKMDKTVVVAVENLVPHPKYNKTIVQTKRYKAHDEDNSCNMGDRIRIRETRPLSKTKRWVVVETIERAPQ